MKRKGQEQKSNWASEDFRVHRDIGIGCDGNLLIDRRFDKRTGSKEAKKNASTQTHRPLQAGQRVWKNQKPFFVCGWCFCFRCALHGKRVKSSVRKAKRVGSCRQILIRKNETVRTRCAIKTRKGEKNRIVHFTYFIVGKNETRSPKRWSP